MRASCDLGRRSYGSAMSGCGIFKSDIFWVENFEKFDFLKSVGNCFGGVGKVFGGPEMGFGGAGKVFWGLTRVGDDTKFSTWITARVTKLDFQFFVKGPYIDMQLDRKSVWGTRGGVFGVWEPSVACLGSVFDAPGPRSRCPMLIKI